MKIEDPSRVSKYTFGTETAVFHICASCGIVPVVSSEIKGKTYAVVSVNAVNGVDPTLFKRAPVSFEGEDGASRLARRVKGWIPSVRFSRGAA